MCFQVCPFGPKSGLLFFNKPPSMFVSPQDFIGLDFISVSDSLYMRSQTEAKKFCPISYAQQ